MGRWATGLSVGILFAVVGKYTTHHLAYVFVFRGHFGLKTRGTVGVWAAGLGWLVHHGQLIDADVDPDVAGAC